MRKLILLLALAALLGSCEKCATCTFTTVTTIYPNLAGYPQTTKVEQELCGDEYKENNMKTTTATTTSGNHTITAKTKCDCK